jgi:hypothetical protein
VFGARAVKKGPDATTAPGLFSALFSLLSFFSALA